MTYVKFKDGRELKGWRAALIAAPYAVMFAPVTIAMGIAALPLIVASKLRKKGDDSDEHKSTKG